MTAPESITQAKNMIGLFPELLGTGGVQQASRMIAAALNEIGVGREWVVDLRSLNDPPGSQELHAGLSPIPFRGFGRAKMRFVFSALVRARKASNSAAPIVLAAHPNLGVPAEWMRRISPALRTIVVCHGLEVWQPLPTYRRHALQRAHLLLAPSRYTAQKLAEVQGIPQERVRRLPWPLDPEFLRLAASPESHSLPRGFPHGRVVLTLGRWVASERYKGADELICAISGLSNRFPDLHLAVVGSGDDLPRLRQLAGDLGAADRVHFLEHLSRGEIAGCFAHADVFALPSTGEGFGLVFLEAMAFAKPVVGAAAGGITDLIGDGVNGRLVPPRDVSKLAEALDRLLRDESLRTEMGRRGFARVQTQYRFEVFRDALENILVEEHASAPA
jgi:phosphatidyl-myo-inositol dimannoside synthase